MVVDASPFPLQPVGITNLSFPANLLWPYLATSHFSFTALTMLWSTHASIHTCSMYYVRNVYFCVHTTQRHTPHNTWTLSGMVRSINNAIFPENTKQYVVLCCSCQKVKFSRPYSPEGKGRTADPLDVHTATMIWFFFKYWNNTHLKRGNWSTAESFLLYFLFFLLFILA